MLTYPSINPVAVSIGPLSIHWYGLMYVIGFLGGWALARWRAKQPNSGWTDEEVSDVIFYAALGVIVGGRLGYLLFYDLPFFLQHPLHSFRIWEGGMSFHGGLIGVICAIAYYAHKSHRSFLSIGDFITPLIPLGLGAGRIGNFINGELWGKVTDLSWGMIFPYAGPYPRHPSQLYEFFLEGVVLFCILWIYSSKPRPTGATSSLFLIFYGSFRFLIELIREPDPQYGYLAFSWLTMGQLLSLPMILAGIALYYFATHSEAAKSSCKLT